MTKFSKIDFATVQRKGGSTKSDKAALAWLLRSEYKTKIKQKFSKLSLANFAAAGLGLVLVLQGLVYISHARSAQGEILGAATSAYSDLNSAKQNLTGQDFVLARKLFDSASGNIQKAQGRLNDFKLLTWLPQATSVNHVLSGAHFLALAGDNLSQALSLLGELKVSSFGADIVPSRELLVSSQNYLRQASEEFGSVSSIPADYEGTFTQAKKQVEQLDSTLTSLISLEDIYLEILGSGKTYLLTFQNYDEARATGGFIGTYGVLKGDNGKIAQLKIASIYNLDGSIHERIAAPGPMQPEIAKWGIRDANWFADFPTSAGKLLGFFEVGGETADGVVAVTPKLFEDLLRLTGPIDMPDYGVTLTPDNFQDVVQYKTSIDYDKTLNQPKKMLNDFAPILLDRLSKLSQEQKLAVLQIFETNLKSRQIMVYSKNTQVQQILADQGYSGKVLDTDYDYLSINNSNLGGTKTDLKMQQKVELNSKILSDGSIINTLQITRTNTASEKNRDYLRVLVPLGSQLISAAGFDPYNFYKSESDGMQTDPDLAKWDAGQILSNTLVHSESGKSEFSGWLQTAPGESKALTIVYVLPSKAGAAHSLLVQKQSGSIGFDLKYYIDAGSRKINWMNISPFESSSNTDDFWAVVLSQ